MDTPVCVDISALDSLLADPRFLQVKQEAEGKDLVLFLGAAGAGKSTCISYLLGAKIESDTDLSGETIAKLGTSAAEVSDIKFPAINPGTGKAHTIYSEVFTDSVLGIHYCDTASFIDTQKTISEHEISASLSMQYAIQSAKRIRAIAIVFEWDIFRRSTPLELYASALILTQLLVDLESMAGSIIFIINKAPQNIKKNHLAHSVACYQAILAENIENLTPKTQIEFPSSPELERLKSVFRMLSVLDTQIKQNPESIVFMDVFDEGESRAVMQALLRKKTNGINKEQFNFREYHPKRKAFEEQITLIAPLMKAHRQKEKTKKNQIETTGEPYFPVSLPENPVKPEEYPIESPISSETLLDVEKPQVLQKNLAEEAQAKPTLQLDAIHGNPENNLTFKQAIPEINTAEHLREKEDITSVLLSLVNVPESSSTETKLPEKITVSISLDAHKTLQTTEVLRSVENENQSHCKTNVCGVLGLVTGMGIALFGLFLLSMGIGALLHWPFALSMVREIFPITLEESIFCGFIYGCLSAIFGGAIFYMTWSICFAETDKIDINPSAEDISHRNNHTAMLPGNLQSVSNYHQPVVSQQTRSAVTQHANDSSENHLLKPQKIAAVSVN